MLAASFDHVISLGPDCLPAMQAQQYFSRGLFSGGLFNFQVTPLASLREYFARDFHGMLERADLERANGMVCNARFGTRHPHQFLNGLDADYDAARERHDYLCEKMRRSLDGTRAVLLITHSRDVQAATKEIQAMLSSYNPRLRYELICLPETVRDDKLWREPLPLWMNAFEAALKGSATIPMRERIRTAVGRQLRRLAGHMTTGRF